MTQRLDFAESLKSAKAELAALQEELGECLAQQEGLEKKIVAIRQMIFGFSSALGQQFEEADELGFTDAMRQTFKTANGPLEPTDVRTRLENIGYNTKKFGNLMASIHTVISRLVRSKEIEPKTIQPGNKTAYVWIQKLEPFGGVTTLASLRHAGPELSGMEQALSGKTPHVPRPPKK
jgi:hypothetical protein